jgi:hypothetical protein
MAQAPVKSCPYRELNTKGEEIKHALLHVLFGSELVRKSPLPSEVRQVIGLFSRRGNTWNCGFREHTHPYFHNGKNYGYA